MAVSSKFYFDARNVPTILVAGGVLLLVIGVLLDSVSSGSGTGAIGLGLLLLLIGVVIYLAKEYSR
jgi:hypothetical protein